MRELRTTEKRILSELLVCGALTEVEYERVTDFNKTIREDGIQQLRECGILEHILYKQ